MKNDLYSKHYSTPFNPRIAQVFFKAGFTESWGRGFTKIQEACEKYECPLPELYMDKGGTMILCNASERYKKLLNNINAQTSPKDRPNIAQTNSILENILILIEDNKYITQNDMAKILGVSRDVIKRNIKKLKDNKKLERNGSKNNGFWIIKK